MIGRYTDPLIDVIFSDKQKIERWRDASVRLIAGRVNAGLAPSKVLAIAQGTPAPDPIAVKTREGDTGHDVVAFLQLWCEGSADSDFQSHLHYGLTSSDLVDSAHFEALFLTTQVYLQYLSRLSHALTSLAATHSRTYMLGRTHGQIAEPTTFGHRLYTFNSVVGRAQGNMRRIRDLLLVRKTPGAVGTRSIYDGLLDDCEVLSTQVIPRDLQVIWALAAIRSIQACEMIATEIRLLSQSGVAEVREGATRIGSSAMPHKNNPITSEKICGLTRVARGYIVPILETQALWADRDISNSSVERVVIPDLANLTGVILRDTARLVADLFVDVERMDRNLGDAGYAPYSSLWVSLLQQQGVPWGEAHTMVFASFNYEDPLLALIERMDAKNLDTITLRNKLAERMCAEWMTRNV